MWGTLAAAIFDWGRSMDQYHGWSGFSCVAGDDGECLQGAGADGIGANVLQIVLVSLWTILWSLLIFLPLRFSGKLTVSDEIQLQGMDSAKHTPSGAYAMQMATPEIYTSEVTPITKLEHLQ
ncbi:AMT1-1 [Symbiodinium microadriaticum]|nr:AMT1-1 [Symbiodinium microadriaticum]